VRDAGVSFRKGEEVLDEASVGDGRIALLGTLLVPLREVSGV
jgi:hypothetical protein